MSSIIHNHSTNSQSCNMSKAKGKQKQKQLNPISPSSILNNITSMGMRINPKKISQHIKKKDYNKSNFNANIKRPQTPDPVSNRCYQSIKYPQPQIILKQIQKNVNVLKQMYYASLTQHNNSHSMRNSREDTLGHSHNITQQSFTHQDNNIHQAGKQINHLRKSFDLIGFNKKSAPQVNLPTNHHPSIPFNTRSFNSHLFQQFYGADKNENKQQKGQKNKKQKKKQSRQRSQKSKLQHRKSSKNLQKKLNGKRTPIVHQDLQKQGRRKTGSHSEYTSPNHQGIQKVKQSHIQENRKSSALNNNINGLFEIFKFYKKSIDTTLSKNTQGNSQNSQKTSIHNMNTHMSTKNHTNSQINTDKSYGKDTPNNSHTKVATGNKNSTNTRLGSIQPSSIEASFEDDPLKNSTKGKKSRNSSTQNSGKKSKNKQKRKNQSYQQKEKNKKTTHFKQQFKELSKNYYNQIHKKKSKQQNSNKSSTNKNTKKSGTEQQSQKQKKSKIGSEKIAKTHKRQEKQFQIIDQLWKKKSTPTVLKAWHKSQEAQHQNPQNRNKMKRNKDQGYENIQYIQFPQIQSSIFDRNMPILEQDSRQEASSQLIALTSYKQNSPNHNNKNAQLTKSGILNLQNVMNSNYDFKQNNKNSLNSQQAKIQDQKLSYQDTRFPTPSFVGSENEQDTKKNSKQFEVRYIKNQTENCIQNQISKKLSCFTFKQKQKYKKSEDSLLDCQIPKRQSDDSDLQNFQLISFQL